MKTRTVTTTFEYDKDGNVTKSTRVEVEQETSDFMPVPMPSYRPPSTGQWDQPLQPIIWSCADSCCVDPSATYELEPKAARTFSVKMQVPA